MKQRSTFGDSNPVESYCNGKQRFESFELASAVASRHGRRPERSLHPYRCQNCRGFHLGGAKRVTKPPPTSRRKVGGYRG